MIPTREQVRDETRAVHAALDTAWMAADGFSSKDAYFAFLNAGLAAHLKLGVPAAFERADGSDVLEHERIAALQQDLGARDAASCAPHSMDRAFAWGVGYALNGSALGAATILKQGQLGSDWPRRYLEMGRDYARTGGVRTFFVRLDREQLDRDRVVAGALAVFELFRAQTLRSTPKHNDHMNGEHG